MSGRFLNCLKSIGWWDFWCWGMWKRKFGSVVFTNRSVLGIDFTPIFVYNKIKAKRRCRNGHLSESG